MRKILTTALLLVVATIARGNDQLFPQPAELDRDVGFWLSIFTEYTTREGVLHDSRNLAVVYEKVPLPENASRRQRQRVSDQRRQHFKQILQTLAGGKRTGLSAEEQRVLDLWPDDVTSKELLHQLNITIN